jgi:hypothetical protein
MHKYFDQSDIFFFKVVAAVGIAALIAIALV